MAVVKLRDKYGKKEVIMKKKTLKKKKQRIEDDQTRKERMTTYNGDWKRWLETNTRETVRQR